MPLAVNCERGNHSICWDEDCACVDCHFKCDGCTGHAKILYEGKCASCVRKLAKSTPYPGTACDKCGSRPAFRNPIHRRNEYLCVACHALSGESVRLPASIGERVTAECAARPLDDDSHEFIKVRGNRYRCRRCHQDVFGRPTGLHVVGELRSRA